MHLLLLSLLLLQGTPGGGRGVLAGQLRALDGSAAASIRVAAVAVPPANQMQEPGLVPLQYVPPPAALVGVTFTDAQGRYRLDVPPGRYFIMAGLNDAPTYYPASKTAAGATVVTMQPGSSAENMNFGLLSTLGIKIKGRVIQNGVRASGGLTATLAGSKVDEFREVPVGADGAFEFVRVPVGSFTLSLFPPPPGFKPVGVTIVNKDVTGLELVLPPTRTVTGRIAVEGDGPLPVGLLSFYTALSRVGATISPDGAFKVVVQEALHRVDVAGLPVGYGLSSVRVGSTDASKGILVEKTDLSGVVITLSVSRPLPRVSGRVVGLNPIAASAKVELKGGHILFPLVAPIRADGTFEFPKVLPDLYELSLPAVRGFAPTPLVVTNQSVDNLELTVRPTQ